MKVTDKYTFFWNGPLSNWHPSKFKNLSGTITFNCAEQYMMYYKARHFGDYNVAFQILQFDDPKIHKNLGRQVENFDSVRWDQVKEFIVYQACKCKFTQNRDLMQLLLDTNGTELVEASPYDTIWGIGMHADEPGVEDSNNWRGQNLLGKILTKLRKDIIQWKI